MAHPLSPRPSFLLPLLSCEDGLSSSRTCVEDMPVNKHLQKEEGVGRRDNEEGGGEAKQSRHPHK